MTLTIEDLKSEHIFQGAWITDKTIPYDKKKSPVPLSVRRTFSLAKKLRRAVLYATAVGNYYVTVNGAKITDEMLAPGYTSYEKYLQYQAYDVTAYLKSENELCAVVSGGWAVGFYGFMGAARGYAPRQLFRCDLVLEYVDGSTEEIATDQSWSQTVKKLHSCLIAYVGATIGRPPTYRSNAFSGTVSCKANGHGRAMLAPTRVFRQSATKAGLLARRVHTASPAFMRVCITMPASRRRTHRGSRRTRLLGAIDRRFFVHTERWRTVRSACIPWNSTPPNAAAPSTISDKIAPPWCA